jgi:hypothetical protein
MDDKASPGHSSLSPRSGSLSSIPEDGRYVSGDEVSPRFSSPANVYQNIKTRKDRRGSAPAKSNPNHAPDQSKAIPESSAEKVIRLNIGGVLHMTTRETLLRVENSFFSTLLSGAFTVPMADRTKTIKTSSNGTSTLLEQIGPNYYFIDRDGDAFRPILNYLRSGVLRIPESIPYEQVKDEADFYMIDLPLVSVSDIQILQMVNASARVSDNAECAFFFSAQ